MRQVTHQVNCCISPAGCVCFNWLLLLSSLRSRAVNQQITHSRLGSHMNKTTCSPKTCSPRSNTCSEVGVTHTCASHMQASSLNLQISGKSEVTVVGIKQVKSLLKSSMSQVRSYTFRAKQWQQFGKKVHSRSSPYFVRLVVTVEVGSVSDF